MRGWGVPKNNKTVNISLPVSALITVFVVVAGTGLVVAGLVVTPLEGYQSVQTVSPPN